MELLGRRFDLLTGKALQADLHVNVTTSKPPLQAESSRTTGRQSLKKILEKAEKKAKKGEGRLPKYLAPIAPDRAARRQFSFSRLSGALHERTSASIVTLPEAEDYLEPALDPLGLGTLVHAVLEEIDFANPGDFAAIVRRHASLHLSKADVDLDEPIDMIGRFLASPRAAQIAAAEEVHRELEFLLAWPPGTAEPGGRYLQGFIDCLYRDQAGGWHIIDYKTNNITAKTLHKRRQNTKCKCWSTPWPPRRFSNIRRSNWCSIFSARVWNINLPGTTKPENGCWTWLINVFRETVAGGCRNACNRR